MISSRTRTIAILGDPIEHSITPHIQNRALQEVGADIVNVAFHVAPTNLKDAVHGAQALGFLGLMITIPHKEAVLSLCNELHPSAQLMGAANLLRFENERIVGHSSDGWAAVKSLEEEGAQVDNQRIAIIGGGGAARSLALTFSTHGAREIVLLNRTIERAQIIADEVQRHNVEARAVELSASTCKSIFPDIDIVVNTTSVGMSPQMENSPLEKSVLERHLTIYDIVYNPLETQLLRDAKSVGCKTVDGLGMLIYTNVYATKTLASIETSPHIMREAALQVLAARS